MAFQLRSKVCACQHRGGEYIEIFQWDDSSFSYQKRWPWRDFTGALGKGYEAMAELYDMDDDGDKEVVALIDTEEGADKGRKLAIYKLSGEAFALVSQIDVTSPDTAVDFLDIRRLRDRKQIVLLLADPRSC